MKPIDPMSIPEAVIAFAQGQAQDGKPVFAVVPSCQLWSDVGLTVAQLLRNADLADPLVQICADGDTHYRFARIQVANSAEAQRLAAAIDGMMANDVGWGVHAPAIAQAAVNNLDFGVVVMANPRLVETRASADGVLVRMASE